MQKPRKFKDRNKRQYRHTYKLEECVSVISVSPTGSRTLINKLQENKELTYMGVKGLLKVRGCSNIRLSSKQKKLIS
jgi:hypothetical protein